MLCIIVWSNLGIIHMGHAPPNKHNILCLYLLWLYDNIKFFTNFYVHFIYSFYQFEILYGHVLLTAGLQLIILVHQKKLKPAVSD